jgi:hypothetical protein
MIKFKHKGTGSVVELSRVRTYINADGSKTNIDPTFTHDLSEYEEIREETNFLSIACTKAINDRRG